MKYMLDTNICIYIIKQKPSKVISHFRHQAIGDIGLSSITLAELEYGVAKSRHAAQNYEALKEFILPLEIALFDEKAANIYGQVRAELEKNGMPIGSMDTLIAAHALSQDVILVTNNTKEFRRVQNLKVVNWSA